MESSPNRAEEPKKAETTPGRMKAWCPRCYMTFEAGKSSLRVVKHTKLDNCNAIPCNKPFSNCVRRFSSINSANRHTYCFTQEDVNKWDINNKICAEDFTDLKFEKLTISDVDNMLALDLKEEDPGEDYVHFPSTEISEGPPYKYPNSMDITELFDLLKVKMGKDFHADTLARFKNAFIMLGYTSAGVLRTAKENRGNWEFLYTEFNHIDASVNGLSHMIKKVLSKRAKSRNP